MLPQINTILLAASLEEGTAYLFSYALCLAEKNNAHIHVVHGHELPDLSAQNMAEIYMFNDEFTDSFNTNLEEAEKRLRSRLEEFCHRQLELLPGAEKLFKEIRIVRKPAKQAILETAKEVGADLIVMGSHRHSVLTDALLGSTTMKVLHSADIPVFVVRIPS